jgi:2-polyprenyl-3-methyl-5-hydroxy-6-metoxy-1,4-benzoquinol methylase
MPDSISSSRRDSIGAQQGLLYETRSRQKKAAKIRAALATVIPDTRELTLLDAGCASGIITRTLAPHFAFAVGIDLHEAGLRIAPEDQPADQPSAKLLRGTTAALPFGDKSFDVVICAQVYEHVADQEALADEVYRVLKTGGWAFFSGPNRVWPIEDHYKLFGLGWLPKKWAGRYLRLVGRGRDFEEHLLTYSQLERLFRRFERIDITARMIRNPSQFQLQSSGASQLASKLPEAAIRGLSWLYPNPNWLLRKPLGSLSGEEFMRKPQESNIRKTD